MAAYKRKGIPDYADSMAQAAGYWGIPKRVIRVAKDNGCPAFVAQRVHRAPLVKWLQENPDIAAQGEAQESAADLKVKKLAAEVRILEGKIARENADVIPKGIVKDEWGRGVAIIFEEAKAFLNRDEYLAFTKACKAKIKTIE
jgi:hypothetical protein